MKLNSELERWLADGRVQVAVILSGAAAAAFLIGWNFLLKPDLTKLRESEERVRQAASKHKTISRIFAAEQKIKGYKGRFAPSADTSWLINFLSASAKQSRVSLTSVTPSTVNKAQEYEIVALALQTRSGYHALGEFISKIESHDSYLLVSDLRIDSEAGALGATLIVTCIHPLGVWEKLLK